MKAYLNNQKGFTLIEVVVALVIVAVGILGLSIVFPLSTRDVGKSGYATVALELCQEQIEKFHNLAYDDSTLTAGSHYDEQNPIYGVYLRSWYVEDDQPIPGCKLIQVNVAWQEHAGGDVTLTTVLASAGR